MVKRILTGMRTTGRLHLGHYVGALENWLRLQREYECFFLLADVQALTTHFDRAGELEESVRQVVIDWLSVGLDPKQSSFCLQTRIPELYELTTMFSFLVDMGELEGNPTLKDEIRGHGMSKVNLGFMMYPVSQAADILLFSPVPPKVGDELLIPVGEDQRPHVELTRDIARKFNRQYGDTLIVPEILVGDVPRLGDLSSGNKKMGKSYGNAIFLSDSVADVQEKVKQGMTDPAKVRKGDSGNPEICPIFSYHKIFNKGMEREIEAGCKSGALGCVDCKLKLTKSLNQKLEPIRAKRAEVEEHPDMVSDAIREGTARACEAAQVTIGAVRHAMCVEYPSLELHKTG